MGLLSPFVGAGLATLLCALAHLGIFLAKLATMVVLQLLLRGAVPTLVALRTSFEEVRREILAADPHLDAAEATRRLVNRLLHSPSEALRALAAENEDGNPDVARIVTRLFGLDDADGGNGEDKD